MNFTHRAFANLHDLELMATFLMQARAFAGHDQGLLHAGGAWWCCGRNGPEAHRVQLWFAAEKRRGTMLPVARG